MSAKILYIEDNPYHVFLIRRIIEKLGYTLIDASNGVRGMDLARQETPELILFEVNLPDGDGVELVSRLKQDTQTRDIPIIALTANVEYGVKEKIMDAGCLAYLVKPISRAMLSKQIKTYLT